MYFLIVPESLKNLQSLLIIIFYVLYNNLFNYQLVQKDSDHTFFLFFLQ